METNANVLVKALEILSQCDLSLEKALEISSLELCLPILDDPKLIRVFLRENNLISHNPKLSITEKKKIDLEKPEVVFVTDRIHKDFIIDSITEKCSTIIKEEDRHLKIKELLNTDYSL
jgi:hypothetical protein